MSTWLRKTVALSTVRSIVVLSLAFTQAPHGYAQTPAQPGAQAKAAAQPSFGLFDHSAGTSSSKPADGATAADNQQLPPAVANALAAMQARIEQLEAELKSKNAHEQAPATGSLVAAGMKTPSATGEAAAGANPATEPAQPDKPAKAEPFAYADWTWLNGTARNKDAVWDSKFFTPEVRFDTHFVHSFNHPKDDTLGGSTEIFRSNEFQVEQISFGGDFHWQNVRGRVLTMNGMFAVTTPRNDASTGRGNWDLRGAYKYVSEAWGGYHFDVNHGLNIDAGIFVSYIGLFSYYNFDNWAYQPSYVSSNTPWFFNGLRIQWFPTDKLKIEPWIINGWQSYGRFGSKPGLGGQILWRPKPWLSLVFNNYGMGEDTLGNGQGNFGRTRIHTDDSVEVKYYDRPQNFLDKMAFSFTADLGCEYGGPVAAGLNVNCHHNTTTSKKQTFAGWMLYNRWWFKKDTYGLTIGGGAMSNPGRYLTLLPPINGADAISGSPYFTANPGDPYKAWDGTVTFDWMPKQYITFRSEYGYRHANVPYFTGPGGITPPSGNSGAPGALVGTATLVPGPQLSATPGLTCVAGAAGWCPDLRKDEPSARFAIMVKF
jgi:hypothetical protein